MDKEEIEELKDFTIDLTNIDELALGLEICSKKSNMVIQEFADTIIQLQQENQQLKERIDKAICYVQENTCWELRTSKLLDILKEVNKKKKKKKKPGVGNTLVQSNNHIFINGYEFKNGKFKRTLRAILECYILF